MFRAIGVSKAPGCPVVLVRVGVLLACFLWGNLALAESEQDARPASDPVLFHFAHSKPRAFVAGRLDLGLNARSSVVLGWGRPHWLWVGVLAASNLTLTQAAQTGGLQLGAPFGELSLLGRRIAASDHRFLSAQDSFNNADLTSGTLGTAHYSVLELALSGVVPVRVGLVYASVWVDRFVALPANTYLYEEIARSVVKGPWVGVEQLGFLFFVTHDKHHRAGLISEHVWSGRSAADVVRFGVAYSGQLTSHLSLFGYLSEPVLSPDSLGLWSAAGGSLSLRYAWASQDP